MARPSKPQIAIYQDADTGMPDPPVESESAQHPYHALTSHQSLDHEDLHGSQYGAAIEDSTPEYIEGRFEIANIMPTDTELDTRRESALTSTSISSLPESSLDTDQECSLPVPYMTTRPSFRRSEAVRRVQLGSPTAFERTPRRQVQHSKSRSGTPRSIRVSTKGSPLSRRHREADEVGEEEKQYPLVLLHITLLPLETRWTMESIQEILSPAIKAKLQLLQSKVSETIGQRGILIPHPRAEYELLEERLLEALELREERITKCGHFRARDSTSSASSGEGSVGSTDSGLGSSLEGDECHVCHHRVKTLNSGIGSRHQKWRIKVFAANGLMRASAWAAAWSEMERVDVEILPWITEDLQKRLDARIMELQGAARRDEEEARIREVVEEQVRIAYEQRKRVDEEEKRSREAEWAQRQFSSKQNEPAMESSTMGDPPAVTEAWSDLHSELPQIYRPNDIPLSLLLRNYLFLLAKDQKNLLIFGLALLAVCMTWRAFFAPAAIELTPLPRALETSGPGYFTALDDVVEIANAVVTKGENAITKLRRIEETVAEVLIDLDPPLLHSPAVTTDSKMKLAEILSDIGVCVNPTYPPVVFGGPS